MAVGEARIGGERNDVHFHSIQLLFLRNNLIDVWSEEWIGSGELCAESALDRGLDFGLGARCDTGVWLASRSMAKQYDVIVKVEICALFFEHVCGVWLCLFGRVVKLETRGRAERSTPRCCPSLSARREVDGGARSVTATRRQETGDRRHELSRH